MNTSNILEKHHYKILITLFIIIFSSGYYFIHYDTDKRIKHHLVDKLENTFIQFKLISNTYKKNSKLIYANISKNSEIIEIFENLNEKNKTASRKKLYEIIKPLYKLAKKSGVKQLHFHLKNNESFLRMHKVSKFGDDLSDIRYSVAYVNEKHKSISGFEQGKVVHGFRYVHPIKNAGGEHLGSVEVSIDTKAFEKVFENTLFIDASFIINKEISEKKVFGDELEKHYSISYESPFYLRGKEQKILDKGLLAFVNENPLKYQRLLQKDLASKRAFSVEIETKTGFYVNSFIPVKNIKDKQVVAYFITSIKSQYLADLHKDVLIMKIVLFLLTLLIVFIVHRNMNYSKALHVEIDNKTKELEESQKKVVQAEKMASLGMLVAGVAHEINTPVGLSITAISHLIDETKILKDDYQHQSMDEEEFERYLEKSSTTSEIVFKNLIRSAELIKNFKQLSTNQSITETVTYNIKEYMDSLLLSMDKQLKALHVEVQITVEEGLMITTYSDALPQILRNFILNSLTHAFSNIQNPLIKIEVKRKDDSILLNYSDNGIGMNEEHLKKLFDPFYTTNRGAGNSGLGMHIIYNLIVEKLEGVIDVTSQENRGVHFNISLPKIGK